MIKNFLILNGFFLSLFLVLHSALSLPLPGHQPPFFLGAASVFSTWNPLDKSANETLTNGNLTAQATNNSTSGVRGTKSATAGKLYFEITLASNSTGNNTGAGITTAADVIGTALVTTSQGLHYAPGGTVWFNTSSICVAAGCPMAINTNSTADFAINLSASPATAFVRACTTVPVCSNWNGSATADPATNTGGFNISARFPGVAAFPSIVANDTSTWVLNVGATTFKQTIPSGFSPWN